jgi:CRISPR-associated protein Cas1
VLVGNVQITAPAAAMLLKEEVDVVLMSSRWYYRGRLVKLGSKFAKLRHQQLRLCDDEVRSLAIAAEIVIGKINNQRVILQRRSDGQIAQALSGMAEMLKRAGTARNLEELRGYEGKAAAYYFEGIRSFFPSEWGFRQREYYPPPDPANALLSLTYTLLRKDIEASIQLVGLDPYLGFFHALGYDRPSLALDLMEEFRPSIADSVVLNLVNGGQIVLEDFERGNDPEAPLHMSEDAIRVLVAAYEKRLEDEIYHPMANGKTNYRRVLELQARQMARVIQGEADRYLTVNIR